MSLTYRLTLHSKTALAEIEEMTEIADRGKQFQIFNIIHHSNKHYEPLYVVCKEYSCVSQSMPAMEKS